ncbi:NAD(P)-dependent oxidoreductase [Amycolatopsis sp. FDAARGOS 1241]|uniref:NAD(P)-dependent oxidoreductase n=1 Tax=Amycolatopsis sp. FDAARGOS 1241 TaxID=2778070 RepID=UPI00195037DE|nr:NAD(P)-dependent oxidoreductase [Amycolatopsis sp. FDAARGOS 1241]QRP50394.1 phosphoglycerate dehydrogenase [Amycolatopsis sp. FDAARGOS 1241]
MTSQVVASGPDDALLALRAAAPGRVCVVPQPSSGGSAAVRALREVEFLVLEHQRTDLLPVLGELPALRLVQTLIAGAEWLEPYLPDRVRLSRPAGARDNAVAEWVAAALLGLAGGLLPAVREQHRREWRRAESAELAGARVVLIGAGSIGRCARDKLAGLGAAVTVVARTGRPEVYPVTALADLVTDADAVVLLVPATAETTGLAGAGLLARMPDGAVLVNAARGTVVDTAALTAEVLSGRLLAVLDVTDPEPLPPEHPLWTAAGCFLSPHIAGATRQGRARAIEAAARRLARYARGER